jgi:ABC-type branched-subunit amino acid transport system ATPase component
LSDVSGAFSTGVLIALIESSGAGKTTLMNVIVGRKTGGYIEGDIRISGHPKVQNTFSRVSGCVEQNNIHFPQVTVEESVMETCQYVGKSCAATYMPFFFANFLWEAKRRRKQERLLNCHLRRIYVFFLYREKIYKSKTKTKTSSKLTIKVGQGQSHHVVEKKNIK